MSFIDLSIFSSALASILFSRAEQFEQFWQRAMSETFLQSLVEIGPVVNEEMLFKEILDDG